MFLLIPAIRIHLHLGIHIINNSKISVCPRLLLPVMGFPPLQFGQQLLAKADIIRCDLDQFVVIDELQSFLKRKHSRRPGR